MLQTSLIYSQNREQIEKDCIINWNKRLERDLFFSKKIDSANNQIAFSLQKTLMSNQSTLRNNFIEERVLEDSINIAMALSDSLSIIEFNLTPKQFIDEFLKMLPVLEESNTYGIAKGNVFIYNDLVDFSKVKSCLYQNEKVKVLGSYNGFYKIVFDYCIITPYKSVGYIKKEDIFFKD
jgi:hypothetical protein